MKGSVRKRKNNAWSYRIDLGYVDGKRRQVEKGGFKSEREATKAMQDVLYHLNNTGDYVENKKISFHTVYEEFIEREGKATRAYATLKRYDSLYRNHIKDEFGPLYVYQISDTMLIDFLNRKRLKYSEKYVTRTVHLSHCSSVFDSWLFSYAIYGVRFAKSVCVRSQENHLTAYFAGSTVT